MTHRTIQAVLVVAAAELLLARSFGQPLLLWEALVSTGAWLALAGLGELARTDRARALWRSAPALAIAALLPLYRDGGPADAGPAAWTAALGLVTLGLLVIRRAEPVPLLALLAAAVAATLLTMPALPPFSGLALLAVGWSALLLLRQRPVLAWSAAVVATQVPVAAPWTAVGRAAGPDVVLVVVDTLRGDAGRAMESYVRLAERGRAHPHATAAGPWTLPSMAALHTGLPVGLHGAGGSSDGPRGIAADVPTVAEQLAAAGYDTAAVVANNPWLGAYGFDRGFAWWDHTGRVDPTALPANPAVPGAHPVPVLVLHTVAGLMGRARPVADADAVVDRALRVLAARRDRSLFLWVHLLDPHLPYSRTPGLERLGVADLRTDPRWASRADLLAEAYAREVEATDRAILRFLDALGPAPPRGRLVVLTSDHGEERLEHGGFEHGHSLYQELLDVPLVMAGAGVAPGVETSVVGLADVGTTLLAAAGLGGLDLRSPVPDRPVVAGNLLTGGGWAVRDRDWKLVHLDGDQLFDLASDPGERRPVDGPAARLRAHAPTEARRGAPAELDPATVEALRALGYQDAPSGPP